MTLGHYGSNAAEVGSAGGPEACMEDGTSPPPQPSSLLVDPQGDISLQVEISDAVSKQDKVKFIQTKVRLHKEQFRRLSQEASGA